MEFLFDHDWDMIEGMCQQLPHMVERLVMENEAWGEQFLNTLREEHPEILQRVQTLVPNLFPGNTKKAL